MSGSSAIQSLVHQEEDIFKRKTLEEEVREEEVEEEQVVSKPLEALSKKDLNLLKSSRSRLYDFPTQVPTVLSAAYSKSQTSQ